jgi:hypothetical protein
MKTHSQHRADTAHLDTRCDHCAERIEAGDPVHHLITYDDTLILCGIGCDHQRQLNAWRDALAADHLRTLDDLAADPCAVPQVGAP